MKQLKIGIFGTGRGCDIAENFRLLGCEITALCDFNPDRLAAAAQRLGGDIAQYQDFDSFIEHDMDAVVLANYFHEHAPYAIRCFERGIHVFSECISNGTMAEGVELVRAFEKYPGCVYMLAENYPQMIFNREMKRVVEGGTLGKILYAEGEYNHPGTPLDVPFLKTYNYFPGHWRNYLPRTYYITHSLGPIMAATGATPKRVTAFAAFAPFDESLPSSRRCGDRTAVITMQCDDGCILRVTGCGGYGGHHNAYRICGTDGQIENLRGMYPKMMLRYDSWNIPEGMQEVNCYDPKWNDPDEELIETSGHGGGDYLTARMFVECIRDGVQPPHPFDIYSATVMSSAAILGHRSMLEGGMPYDIPDFREEEWRVKYENDRLTPFPGTDGSEPTLPCCSVPDFAPTEEQIKGYLELLKD